VDAAAAPARTAAGRVRVARAGVDRALGLILHRRSTRENKMRKVTTGSLNGNAYQFEEDAFAAVQAYLQSAAAKFATNPDRAEIMADLERAIADKCDTFLGRHKTVVSVEEARQVLREMGPVDSSSTQPDDVSPEYAAAAEPATQVVYVAPRRRRLFRLPHEGMIGGVCAGVAAYVNVDVVWVRLAYVLLTFCTGVWFLVWFVQLCITPKVVTPEDIAAAHGDPLTAREVVDHARRTGRAAAEGMRDAGRNVRSAFGR
jgi:phage shock protein PspC (stress-responsive transcriptional regulator)